MRTTVQIVEIVDGVEKHVKKLTCTLTGQEVLGMVRNLLSEHLVRQKTPTELIKEIEERNAYRYK